MCVAPAYSPPAATYTLYVNGLPFPPLTLVNPLLNHSPLLLGAAPGMNGPAMLISNLAIYPVHLPPSTATPSPNTCTLLPHPLSPLQSSLPLIPLPSAITSPAAPLLAEASSLLASDCTDPLGRLHLYTAAANEGSTLAALRAAEMHLYGIEHDHLGTPAETCVRIPPDRRDNDKATYWLQIAVDDANPQAM